MLLRHYGGQQAPIQLDAIRNHCDLSDRHRRDGRAPLTARQQRYTKADPTRTHRAVAADGSLTTITSKPNLEDCTHAWSRASTCGPSRRGAPPLTAVTAA